MRNLTVFVVLLLSMSGCALMGPGGDDPWAYSEHSIDAEIQQASLSGDMADLGTFDGDAYEATYDGWGGASTITLHAGQDGGSDFGWAMMGLTTSAEGGFEGDTFAPGTTISMEEGQIDVQGCTGPAHGDWDFDGHAGEVEVQVEEGPTPGSRLFFVRAVFDEEDGGVTEGSFILAPNNEGSVNDGSANAPVAQR